MMFLPLMLAGLLGVSMVALLWPRNRTLRGDGALLVALGAIVGLFVTSVCFFAVTLWSARPAWHASGIEIALVIVMLWRAGLRWRQESQVSAFAAWTWLDGLLAMIFVQCAIVAGVVSWRSFQAEPLGGWDGWAIWNMHARFMLRAGTSWPDLLAAPQLNWTHPDYPRLIPASVARMWAWTGREEPAAAALVSVMFAGAIVALLVAAVSHVRGRGVALLSGIVVLATPFFITFAANQHADIPLASFMLAAVVLAGVATRGPRANGAWILAGICAGGAAWTKNEGLLFAVVFAAAVVIHAWRSGARDTVGYFLAALGVGLIPVACFKLCLAPANDLVSAMAGSGLEKVWDLERHRVILRTLWRDLGRFGEWPIAPWLLLALPFLAWRERRHFAAAECLVPVVMGLMLAGYYAVYLVSPQDLAWHLDTSLVRLLLQLWPLAVFTWGLAVPYSVNSGTRALAVKRRYSQRALLAGANILVASGVLAVLASQRGANELAVQRVGLAEVSVALGDGWFPVERHGRDEWSWSSGPAQLRLQVSGRAERTVTLRFGLGSAGPRTVVIRAGDRELWRGALRDQRVPVTVAGLTLPAGATTMEFTTDTAGVNEAPAAGGRMLSFAIYNLHLE